MEQVASNKKLLLHNREEKIKHELKLNNDDIAEHYRKEKFEKMSASPYAFYRGSNHLYWEDFYNDWRLDFFGGSPETLTWINGDAHIYNYGAYTNHYGSANFCMDDFDDSIVADYQFDLWRMAVSIILDCREKAVFDEDVIQKAVRRFARAYCQELMTHSEDDPNNEVHCTKDTTSGKLSKFLQKVELNKNRTKMLNKWTVVNGNQRSFDFENEKLEKLSSEEYKAIELALEAYKKKLYDQFSEKEAPFEIKDIARRIKAGTGSLGSKRYYILLEGLTSLPDDDLILDMKEQGKPPLYRHMTKEEKEEYSKAYPEEGKRHALAFQALAEHPDKYLGDVIYNGISFSIKERSPMKADFPTEKLKKKSDLFFMANTWGTILASRHKRASYVLNDQAHEMPEAFREMVTDRERTFEDLVLSIAIQYAERVNGDYISFLKMVE